MNNTIYDQPQNPPVYDFSIPAGTPPAAQEIPAAPEEIPAAPVADGVAAGEIERLAEAIAQEQDGEGYMVASDGTIHLAGDVNDAENMTQVANKPFGAPTDDEVERLAQAYANDNTDGYVVAPDGSIHLAGEVADGENLTEVAEDPFGAPGDDEVEKLAQAYANDNTDGYVVAPDGSIHLAGEVADGENLTEVAEDPFGAPGDDDVEKLAQAYANDNTDGYVVAPDGSIHLAGEVADEENMTVVAEDPFGAHEDQWYKKNPRLLQAEIAAMHMRFPKARHGFYPENGNMYWLVKVNVFGDGSVKPWTFQLVYDKDHPHKRGYGGSLKVKPIVPSLADLETIAKAHGRPGVPHVIRSDSHFLKRYLCTRWPDDISTGISAVQATAWAVDWAAHFEIGMRNKKAWNKWCNDDHFRHLQIP